MGSAVIGGFGCEILDESRLTVGGDANDHYENKNKEARAKIDASEREAHDWGGEILSHKRTFWMPTYWRPFKKAEMTASGREKDNEY